MLREKIITLLCNPTREGGYSKLSRRAESPGICPCSNEVALQKMSVPRTCSMLLDKPSSYSSNTPVGIDLKPSSPSGRKNGAHDLCGGILYAAEDEPRRPYHDNKKN